MKRLLVLLGCVALGLVGFVYWRAKTAERELAAERQNDVERARAHRASMRKIAIDGAESLAKRLEALESIGYEHRLKAAKDRTQTELLHEQAITNIRLECAAAIEKAKRDYPD